MIDFDSSKFVKLDLCGNCDMEYIKTMIEPMFCDGEYIIEAYRSMRDSVVFTNKRIITVNVQGLSGQKKDFTSLPYSKIQAYSVETAGTFDRDSELVLWFSGLGKVKFEFSRSTKIQTICKTISEMVL